jgi:hypothetical protein
MKLTEKDVDDFIAMKEMYALQNVMLDKNQTEPVRTKAGLAYLEGHTSLDGQTVSEILESGVSEAVQLRIVDLVIAYVKEVAREYPYATAVEDSSPNHRLLFSRFTSLVKLTTGKAKEKAEEAAMTALRELPSPFAVYGSCLEGALASNVFGPASTVIIGKMYVDYSVMKEDKAFEPGYQQIIRIMNGEFRYPGKVMKFDAPKGLVDYAKSKLDEAAIRFLGVLESRKDQPMGPSRHQQAEDMAKCQELSLAVRERAGDLLLRINEEEVKTDRSYAERRYLIIAKDEKLPQKTRAEALKLAEQYEKERHRGMLGELSAAKKTLSPLADVLSTPLPGGFGTARAKDGPAARKGRVTS